MKNILRSKLFYAALVIITAGAYLYLTDFQLLKNLIGYNVPPLATPSATPAETLAPSEFPFLSISDDLKMSSFASGLDRPRVIEFDPAGRVVVSETQMGRVSVIDGGGKTLIDNLNLPHGLAFLQRPEATYLYIAETHWVVRYVYDVAGGNIVGNGQNIADLPSGGGHFTRTIGFSPDGRLYISIGSSCNVCNESDERRAAIYSVNWDGSDFKKYADGLRNAVFFTFHPITGQMWATEMGRDRLGDDLPPDEVNIIREDGWYGWPWFYGNNIEDFNFSPNVRPAFAEEPVPGLIDLQAHSAPLGLAFVPAEFSREWEGDLIVAFHGSWNRSVPTGYKIVRYDLDRNGNVLSQEPTDFISGWLSQNSKFKIQNSEIYGRPVDLKFGPDGALYISDDAAGLIYKVKPNLNS